MCCLSMALGGHSAEIFRIASGRWYPVAGGKTRIGIVGRSDYRVAAWMPNPINVRLWGSAALIALCSFPLRMKNLLFHSGDIESLCDCPVRMAWIFRIDCTGRLRCVHPSVAVKLWDPYLMLFVGADVTIIMENAKRIWRAPLQKNGQEVPFM